MAKFYAWSNNGVIAVISETVFELIQDRREKEGHTEAVGRGRPQLPYPRPIFTFADLRMMPFKNEWVTGSTNLMNILLEGHQVEHCSFYVPFSNGYEYGGNSPKRNAHSAQRSPRPWQLLASAA